MHQIWWLMACLLIVAPPLYAGSALLTWVAPTQNSDGTPLQDLAGYKAYWGTSSGSYSAEVDVGMATSVSLSGLPDGQTVFFAVTAYDTSNNESVYSNESSKAIPAGDTTPPTVSITNPANGATVPRNTNVMINVDASDNVGVSTVNIKVNGTSICADSTNPYSCSWSVPAPPNRVYTLQATASDATGNSTTSASVQVTSQ